MVKKYSIHLLVTLFATSFSSMGMLAVKQMGQGCGAHVENGSPSNPLADAKSKNEHSPKQSPTPPPMGGAAPSGVPAMAALPAAQPTPPAAAQAQTPAADVKKAKEPVKITLDALIEREKIFYVVPTFINKSTRGTDRVTLDALNALKKDEETLDCADSETQAIFGRAVAAIINAKNIPHAQELLKLAKVNRISIDKTHRNNLRKFLKEHRESQKKALTEQYHQNCERLKKEYEEGVKGVNETSSLIDDTYALGGRHNLSAEQIAFLKVKHMPYMLVAAGDSRNLSAEQQKALEKQRKDRQDAGLSDNEEDHPAYAATDWLISIAPGSLFVMQPSIKSIKPAIK